MTIATIILSTLAFFVIWWIILKTKLIYDEKTPLKNIDKRIEAQEKKEFNIYGKKVLGGEIISKDEKEEESKKADPKPKPKTKPKPKKKAVKKK